MQSCIQGKREALKDWKKEKLKIDAECIVVDLLVNRTHFLNALINLGSNFYTSISKKAANQLKLPHIQIKLYNLTGITEPIGKTISKVIYA